MDTPVFLSKEEKRQAEQYMKYQELITDMYNSYRNKDIFVDEPKIDLF